MQTVCTVQWRIKNTVFPNLHLSTIQVEFKWQQGQLSQAVLSSPLTLPASSLASGEQRRLTACMGWCSPSLLNRATNVSDINDFFSLSKWSYHQGLNSAGFLMDQYLTHISFSLVIASLGWKTPNSEFLKVKEDFAGIVQELDNK